MASGIGFDSVAVGATHSCGLASDGRILCWGDDLRAQLGTGGTPTLSATPLPMSGPRRYRSVGVLDDVTSARTTGDWAQCPGGQIASPTFVAEP